MTELFKDINGYEGLYQISNFGNVRSLHTINSSKKDASGIRKLQTHKNGYKFICLYKNSIGKQFRIHRLVAETFIENKHNYSEVDHIDGNKTNNKLDNLRWCSKHQNMSFDNRKTKNSYSKFVGVSFDKNINKFKSTIKKNGVSKFLGYYLDENEASMAYQSELKLYI